MKVRLQGMLAPQNSTLSMKTPITHSLKNVRTDGWFERIGEQIGSFQALCDIVGERFVAFSLITGTRITELAIDRRSPDNTVVVFVAGEMSGDDFEVEPQRTTLGDFRRRLVASLLAPDEPAVAPLTEGDAEALQLHIGVRNLLLAPLYGYALQELAVSDDGVSVIAFDVENTRVELELEEFRSRLRTLVRDELDRLGPPQRGVIELARVGEAQTAADKNDWGKVKQLLGAWPAPLSIFLRTPDGQSLGPEARALIAKALSLLAVAHARTGDPEQSEEIFRLAVQYAQEAPAASDVFLQLGMTWLEAGRNGEAIAVLRRAINLGAATGPSWTLLMRAFIARKRYVAALACLDEVRRAGVANAELEPDRMAIEQGLGPLWATLRDAPGTRTLFAE